MWKNPLTCVGIETKIISRKFPHGSKGFCTLCVSWNLFTKCKNPLTCVGIETKIISRKFPHRSKGFCITFVKTFQDTQSVQKPFDLCGHFLKMILVSIPTQVKRFLNNFCKKVSRYTKCGKTLWPVWELSRNYFDFDSHTGQRVFA